MDDGVVSVEEAKLITDEGKRLGVDFSSVLRGLKDDPTSEISGVMYREMMRVVNKDRGFGEQVVLRSFGIENN